MTPDEYFKLRVDDQIGWFSDKSGANQRRFMRLRFCELVLAASLPFLAGYADLPRMKPVVGIVGVALAVLAGALSLFRFPENWVQYRASSEALKREKFQFLTGAGPYRDQQAFPDFVARVESLLSAEQAGWIERTARTDSGGPAGSPVAGAPSGAGAAGKT